MINYHKSVLLQETIDGLHVAEGKKYIDATLGAGGHSKEILSRGGIVLGIDQDDDALSYATKELEGLPITIVKGNFSRLSEIAKAHDFENVSGVLFDIGVSSHQLDTGERGFSFLKDAPLDMRMDTSLGVTAADLVNGLTKGELYELFTKYGEEQFAHRIVKNILAARTVTPITRTGELADIVVRSYPMKQKIHPATKVFQALRIAVNDELNSLKESLPQALSLLETGGRLVVISFHSLEDRIVKNSFKEFAEQGLGKIMTDKPIEAGNEEMDENRRSRSAKLRIFEKL